ncbi:ComEA family DNA-binding protein [Kangiella geojedonensis]|uniref:DNA uptake protein family DNA-binding protein n=1 Tax=Kangiella geojedonensis TaxID=914150 RepID=A0A0F6RCW1_9GAMM|nr:helix-hairpin-helix domain-containing protein [Kangiella geojedonensis]AKE52371.1 DNA uptake protein family DNA-binding protein [Kangiella geojedonensis]
MKLFATLAMVLTCFLGQAVQAKDKVERPSTTQSQQKLSQVNINTATTSQLAAVMKGVGLKKAEAIIEYRKKFGPFKSIDELTAVKGIGSKTLQKNRAKLTI